MHALRNLWGAWTSRRNKLGIPVIPPSFPVIAISAGFLLGFMLLAHIQLGTYMEQRRIAAARSGLREVAAALEMYSVDNMVYPIWGAMESNTLDRRIGKSPARTSTTFQMPDGTSGTRFTSLTTPIVYLRRYPCDPFAPELASFRYFTQNSSSFIIGSFGPDRDSATGGDLGWDKPTSCAVSRSGGHGDRYGPVTILTDFDKIPKANGVMTVPTTSALARTLFASHGVAAVYSMSRDPSDPFLQTGSGVPGGEAFTYDPTNGLVSPGDIYIRAHESR